jgi:hypothetical protein
LVLIISISWRAIAPKRRYPILASVLRSGRGVTGFLAGLIDVADGRVHDATDLILTTTVLKIDRGLRNGSLC